MRFQKFLGPRERVATAQRNAAEVAVIMPTSGGIPSSQLQRAIDAVLGQTFRNFELTIADDGSTDGTEAICRNYAARDPRIVYVRYKQPCGLPAVRVDAAIVAAKAPLVSFMFNDHVWHADALESLVETIRSCPADVVHANVDAVSSAGTNRSFGAAPVCEELMAGRNTVPSAAVLCRRDFFDRYGLFDPHIVLRRSCDWDLWLRAVRLGATFRHCDKSVARQQAAPTLKAGGQSCAWDYKASYAYMACMPRLAARTQALLPANIDKYDVYDRYRLTPYLRNSHEWKVTEKLVYEPYFSAHPHCAAAAGPASKGAADLFPHGVKERMRVLLVSNVYHSVVAGWNRKLASDGRALVLFASEPQAGLFPPGDIDLLVLFDCTSPRLLDVLAAHATAGVPITYCTVFGEDDGPSVGLKYADLPSLQEGEFYFAQPGVPWNCQQRASAERLKSRANCVLQLRADGSQELSSQLASPVAWA
jgi:glycosyltransferase involved in cell wall biosynthesis